MRTVTKEINLYKFNELSETAKDKVRSWHAEGLDYEWWDCIDETVKTAGACIGIRVDRILFTGFYSQGYGACFEGHYAYAKGWRKALRKEFGGDILKELEEIGSQLQRLQAPTFYRTTATVRHVGRYYRSQSASIEFNSELPSSDEYYFRAALRSFMDWTYELLRTEYEYITSDECIIEKDEEYDEDGNFIANEGD